MRTAACVTSTVPGERNSSVTTGSSVSPAAAGHSGQDPRPCAKVGHVTHDLRDDVALMTVSFLSRDC